MAPSKKREAVARVTRSTAHLVSRVKQQTKPSIACVKAPSKKAPSKPAHQQSATTKAKRKQVIKHSQHTRDRLSAGKEAIPKVAAITKKRKSEDEVQDPLRGFKYQKTSIKVREKEGYVSRLKMIKQRLRSEGTADGYMMSEEELEDLYQSIALDLEPDALTTESVEFLIWWKLWFEGDDPFPEVNPYPEPDTNHSSMEPYPLVVTRGDVGYHSRLCIIRSRALTDKNLHSMGRLTDDGFRELYTQIFEEELEDWKEHHECRPGAEFQHRVEMKLWARVCYSCSCSFPETTRQ